MRCPTQERRRCSPPKADVALAPPVRRPVPWAWLGGVLLLVGAALVWGLSRWAEPEVIELTPHRAGGPAAAARVEANDASVEPDVGASDAMAPPDTGVPAVATDAETRDPPRADPGTAKKKKRRAPKREPVPKNRPPEDEIEPWE